MNYKEYVHMLIYIYIHINIDQKSENCKIIFSEEKSNSFVDLLKFSFSFTHLVEN